jgi:DNA polymerase-3 subunit alpha
VVIRGRVRWRDDQIQLMALEMSQPDLSAADEAPVTLSMPVAKCTPPVVQRLKEVLATHPGVTEVHLRLISPGRSTMMRLEDGLRVQRSPALFGEVPERSPPRLGTYRDSDARPVAV